jgi:hypothetical protein
VQKIAQPVRGTAVAISPSGSPRGYRSDIPVSILAPSFPFSMV